MDIASTLEWHNEYGRNAETGEIWDYTRKVTVFEDRNVAGRLQREYFAQPVDLIQPQTVIFDLFDDSGNKVGEGLTLDQLAASAESHFADFAERVAEGSLEWA